MQKKYKPERFYCLPGFNTSDSFIVELSLLPASHVPCHGEGEWLLASSCWHFSNHILVLCSMFRIVWGCGFMQHQQLMAI